MGAKNDAPSFVVEEHGEPVLENGEVAEATEDTTPGGAPPPSGSPQQVIAEELWTPEEAQNFLHMFWNLGFWFYGVEWLAQPFDFKRSSYDAAWVLDRLLPKSLGGPVGWTIHVTSIASDIAMSAGLRRELIRRGPQSPAENMKELMQRYGVQSPPPVAVNEEAPETAAPGPPAAKKEKPQPVATQNGDSFAFTSDVRKALDNFPDGSRGTEQYLP